jgi:tryptophanyl-tRNA synthetase
VGKDQAQHIEMTRDVASRFHATMGKEVFVLPEVKHNEETMYVPGTDGAKMSKSKGNIIDIFLPDKKLRKQIMGIQTDSTPMEEPKDPDSCNVFALYKLLASPEQISEMRANYEGGNYGYGHAKQAVYEVVIEKYAHQRERYNHYMANLNEIDAALTIGATKAKAVANDVLKRVRNQIGY